MRIDLNNTFIQEKQIWFSLKNAPKAQVLYLHYREHLIKDTIFYPWGCFLYNGLPCMMNNYMLGHWQIKEQGIFICMKLLSYYFDQFASVHDISSNVLNQWIALKAHSDWLHKCWISFGIQRRATCRGFTPENVVIIARMNELKASFCVTLSHCFSKY